MIKRLYQKMASNRGQIGISRSKEGVALAKVLPKPGSKPRLTVCEYLPGDVGQSQRLLNKACQQRSVSSSHAVCVLEMGCYQLLQVTPPDVPQDEMREAVRWQIGDLIDYPAEEAVVDHFPIPSANQREKFRNIYVVAAHQDQVAERIAWMQSARLKIRAVDIPELVLCNLLNQFTDTGRGVGCLYFDDDSGLILLSSAKKLCLARNLPFGTHELMAETSRLEPAIEAIALEIQRSFDFYERNFGQASIASLMVAPREFDTTPLLKGLHTSLGIDFTMLDLEQILECPDPLPAHAGRCLLAIGAALREDEVGK
jgi:MSHA biogenesis protein MshI